MTYTEKLSLEHKADTITIEPRQPMETQSGIPEVRSDEIFQEVAKQISEKLAAKRSFK